MKATGPMLTIMEQQTQIRELKAMLADCYWPLVCCDSELSAIVHHRPVRPEESRRAYGEARRMAERIKAAGLNPPVPDWAK